MSASLGSNPHASTKSVAWGPDDAPLAVVTLHGRGQSPEVMRELADRIGVEGMRWEAPRAHNNEWYPHRFMDPALLKDQALTWACEAVDAAVARLERVGFTKDRIVLLGFSQGACLGAHWVLQGQPSLAGLVLFTGGYIGPEGTEPAVTADLGGTQVLISGPEADAWVPLSRMRETEEKLRGFRARVTAHYLPPGEHTVTAEEARLAAELLRNAIVLHTNPSNPAEEE